MSDPIGPGDWVECVGRLGKVAHESSPPWAKVSGPWPRVGGLYQVRDVGDYNCQGLGLEAGVRLVGTVVSLPGHPDAWFGAIAFRPIYRPKASVIQGLLRPTALDEEAKRVEKVSA